MKRVVLVALIVGAVGLLGLAAYAYGSGKCPFAGRRAAECPVAPSGDAGSRCGSAAQCHPDGQSCPQDCAKCPCFEDKDKDGRCDRIGNCDCPGRDDCPGHAKGGCGRHGGPRRGCASACARTSR
jgi:hypothetical protein